MNFVNGLLRASAAIYMTSHIEREVNVWSILQSANKLVPEEKDL